MKKPEEIKKAIVYCVTGPCPLDECPYYESPECSCGIDRNKDALRYIEQLESKLEQAAEDIRMLGRMGEFICPVCDHYNHGEGTSGECVKCLTGDGFRWRGEKEE